MKTYDFTVRIRVKGIDPWLAEDTVRDALDGIDKTLLAGECEIVDVEVVGKDVTED